MDKTALIWMNDGTCHIWELESYVGHSPRSLLESIGEVHINYFDWGMDCIEDQFYSYFECDYEVDDDDGDSYYEKYQLPDNFRPIPKNIEGFLSHPMVKIHSLKPFKNTKMKIRVLPK